ncbi:MAG TPA: NADH-quinone oxidoreductase subunit C [Burkholderiales bacterium]|nr:NADH-quinone oxidoreductase subunit C [Burkholderiales bacterium]
MKIEDLLPDFRCIPGATKCWRAQVDAATWRLTAHQIWEKGGRLVALWGSDEGRTYCAHAALALRSGLLWLTLPLSAQLPEYPELSDLFACANRMQRATFDLLGLCARGADDTRSWLRHGAWPADVFPLRRSFNPLQEFTQTPEQYRFVEVEGDGVHEIPVGPVHAGIIEPGHFRFSVVGERVLRLEERLGYVHKGIEKRFEMLGIHEGYRLAGRISGDSTVAYAWAYAMAAEGAAELTPPARAIWLRALFLERERVANHLGDLGFIGNDAGLAVGLAQFSRLKEEWLRTNADLFGHRYLMDTIVPGGVAVDLHTSGFATLHDEIVRVRAEVQRLKAIYDDHSGLQDRFAGTGQVTTELARRLGLVGLAARASGLPLDLRADLPWSPYEHLQVRPTIHADGDVLARVEVRFGEILRSLDLCGRILDQMPEGNFATLFASPVEGADGAGWVEGWRGEILVALEAGANGSLRRVHAHDPSWQNWPLLEHAIIGNIVPDFPLINKSFNLSYSGHDL